MEFMYVSRGEFEESLRRSSKYVVKVQFEETLLRVILGQSELDFASLETRIREKFRIAPTVALVFKYWDKDGDFVTMIDDYDLADALVLQEINPLRIQVTLKVPKGHSGGTRKQQSPTIGDPWYQSSAEEVLKWLKAAQAHSGGIVPPDFAGNEQPQIRYRVKCDSCGTIPKGSRYKSTKEFDYDLCRECFDASGSAPGDYVKIVDSNVGSLSQLLHIPSVKLQSRPASALQRSIDALPSRCRNICRTSESATNSAPKSGSPSSSAENASTSEAAIISGSGVTKEVLKHETVTCDGCGMCPLVGPRLVSRTKWNYDLCTGCFEKSGEPANDFYKIDETGYKWIRVETPFSRYGFLARVPKSEEKSEGRSSENSKKVVINHPCECNAPNTLVETGKGDTSLSGDAAADESDLKQHLDFDEAAQENNLNHHLLSLDQTLDSEEAEQKNDTNQHLESTNAATENDLHQHLEWKEAGVEAVVEASEPSQKSIERVHAIDENKSEVFVPTILDSHVEKDAEPLLAEANKPELFVIKADVTAPEASTSTGSKISTSQDDSSSPTAVSEVKVAAKEDDLSTQETLLAKLTAIGFTDQKLNLELLKKNQYNLRKTVENLCVAEEWDPILEELQKMGFHNPDLNRNLLFNHNGNAKQVVKELVELSRIPITVKGGKQA